MAIAREPIIAGMAARLAAIPGVVTFTRKPRDVEPAAQPAIVMVQAEQSGNQDDPGLPTMWTMNVELYVYVHGDDADGPAADLNSLIDAIDAALEGLSLGQDAYGCRVVRVDTAVEEGQGIGQVNVQIRATG